MIDRLIEASLRKRFLIFTDGSGRSPQEVEDQVTYPLTVSLQRLPGVRVVHSSSAHSTVWRRHSR